MGRQAVDGLSGKKEACYASNACIRLYGIALGATYAEA